MHCLETINRLNAEAHANAITAARAGGKFVLARYCGLHLIEHTEHDSHEAAVMAGRARPAQISERLHVLEPLGSAHAALARGRDQSEDYVAG